MTESPRDRARRRFLGRTAATVSVFTFSAFTQGCATTTSGAVTTVTLNVTTVKNYGQAGLNAAATVAGFLSKLPNLSSYMIAVTAAELALSGALSAFSDAAGSTLTITYDDATWKKRVDSILTDLSTVADTIAASIAGASSGLSSAAQSDTAAALNALDTIIALFQALLGTTSAARPTTSRTLSEIQALHILGVMR